MPLGGGQGGLLATWLGSPPKKTAGPLIAALQYRIVKGLMSSWEGMVAASGS